MVTPLAPSWHRRDRFWLCTIGVSFHQTRLLPIMSTHAQEHWIPTSRPPQLNADEIHVWRFSLRHSADRVAELKRCLNADELRRAQRLTRDDARRRHIVSHGMMRTLLAAYLGGNAADVEFDRGIYGKPYLAGAHVLQFNLSNSADVALLAVSANCEVGVDLEYMRDNIAALKLARRFFLKAEADALETISPAERRQAFFLSWTRKEALLKGTGEGIRKGGLGRIYTPVHAAPDSIWQTSEDGLKPCRARDLPPIPDYAACIAVRGGATALRCMSYIEPN